MTSLDQCGPAHEQGYSAADHTQVNVTLEPVEDLAGEALVEFAPVEADWRAGRCLRRGLWFQRLSGPYVRRLAAFCERGQGGGVACRYALVDLVELVELVDQ